MTRPFLVIGLSLLFVLLVVPSVVAQFLPQEEQSEANGQAETGQHGEVDEVVDLNSEEGTDDLSIHVPVYRTQSQTVEEVELEEYVRGVIASEMPPEFELEALKAQALAARTYIVRRMIEQDFSDTPEGTYVTDTVKHQVYHNDEELRQRWGSEYEENISRMNEAVNETMGQILTHEGEPIDATYFSTSNGQTENAEDYWDQEIPYLRSVESPWDEESPRYEQTVSMPVEEFQERLGVQLTVPVGSDEPFSDIESRTEGGNVETVSIEEESFTGKEVRELLDLDSADFEWEMEGDQIVIHMNGYGHGVGMSQYGANGMAQEGYTAEEIVAYYYDEIDVQDYRQWIVRK